ncbi:CidA/LrgA family protein [Bacillus testis]|uniref:CidA/LrgA family protein n=1 Tax=Bacillus testis TaxID=1622072 RepID=UPI001E2CFB18|nr:CidA/LrgA family holin-like protein [Bacillus testis]
MIKTIFQVCILIIFSAVGSFLHNTIHIPIPGSILGLLLLFVALSFNILPSRFVDQGANFLIAFFPLLFVPVFIGVMNYSSLLSLKGILLLILIIVSTAITMVLAGSASQIIERFQHKKEVEHL